MRFNAAVLVVLSLSMALIASSEEIRHSNAGRLGLSAERMGRIDALFERQIDEGRVAGAVGLVARHGRIGYCKAFGAQDVASGYQTIEE